MELGTSIKTIRKAKGIPQKVLAEKCEISVNALGLIENNTSMPKKSTFDKICESLDVPASHILFFALNDIDVDEAKRPAFNALKSGMKDLLFHR